MYTSITLVTFAFVGAADAGPTLSGVVQDHEGRPIAGASIFVSAAKPRKGPGYL